MKQSHFVKLSAAVLAAAGLLLPESLLMAADNTSSAAAMPAAPVATDIALGQGGLLKGQVVNAQGHVVKQASVTIWHENNQIAKTAADENGEFSVTGLRGGVHYVVAGQGYGVYRFWTAQTAPPSAQPTAVVVNNQIVRGQETPIGAALSSPILWGVVGYIAGHVVGFNDGLDHGGPSSP